MFHQIKQRYGFVHYGYGVFFLAVVLYGSYAVVLAETLDLPQAFRVGFYQAFFALRNHEVAFLYLFLFIGMMALALHLAWILLVIRPKFPVRYVWDCYLRRFKLIERLKSALPILIAMRCFFVCFSFYKQLIPRECGFKSDPLLSDWDLGLHGGIYPWQLFEKLYDHAVLIYGINVSYNIWLFTLNGFILFFAFSIRHPILKLRFFLATVFSWIALGTVMACQWAAAGPCYYADVYPDKLNPYAPLFDKLNQVNGQIEIWALSIQRALWGINAAGEYVFGSGISAMPSMHVVMTTLFACAAWSLSRVFGVIMAAYLLIIILGSVVLGWHYAVDGYLGVIGGLLIWWLAGRAVFCRESEKVIKHAK